MSEFHVRPDGRQLGALAKLAADGRLSLPVAAVTGLSGADGALARVVSGSVHGSLVVTP